MAGGCSGTARVFIPLVSSQYRQMIQCHHYLSYISIVLPRSKQNLLLLDHLSATGIATSFGVVAMMVCSLICFRVSLVFTRCALTVCLPRLGFIAEIAAGHYPMLSPSGVGDFSSYLAIVLLKRCHALRAAAVATYVARYLKS